MRRLIIMLSCFVYALPCLASNRTEFASELCWKWLMGLGTTVMKRGPNSNGIQELHYDRSLELKPHLIFFKLTGKGGQTVIDTLKMIAAHEKYQMRFVSSVTHSMDDFIMLMVYAVPGELPKYLDFVERAFDPKLKLIDVISPANAIKLPYTEEGIELPESATFEDIVERFHDWVFSIRGPGEPNRARSTVLKMKVGSREFAVIEKGEYENQLRLISLSGFQGHFASLGPEYQGSDVVQLLRIDDWYGKTYRVTHRKGMLSIADLVIIPLTTVDTIKKVAEEPKTVLEIFQILYDAEYRAERRN